MSVLAIASVTRLLKDLLNDTLVNGDITGDLGVDVVVTALPPDRVINGESENQPTQLNLFLHRITPNAALATSDLPTRDGRGRLVARPRLALDLHYLLTAYGAQELQAEILLGYAMELFHELPILPREMVRAALAGGVNGAILPPVFQNADPARLADQLELIRITPEPLSLDDMSKVWTAMQTNYRTTVGYQVSVVFVERDLATRTPLPVLSRGRRDPVSGRDAGVVVRTGLRPASPLIDRLTPEAGRPALRLGDRLTLSGHRLDEGEARVRFTRPESGGHLDLAPDGPPTAGGLTVTLPSGPPLAPASPLAGSAADPGSWRVGPYLVDVELRQAGRGARVTNRLPVTLAPRATPAVAADPGGVRITVGAEPRIRAGQTVSIIVGESEAVLPAAAADNDSVEAVFADLPSGADLPVRLRVAGIDSLLIDPGLTPPGFDPTQLVTTP